MCHAPCNRGISAKAQPMRATDVGAHKLGESMKKRFLARSGRQRRWRLQKGTEQPRHSGCHGGALTSLGGVGIAPFGAYFTLCLNLAVVMEGFGAVRNFL